MDALPARFGLIVVRRAGGVKERSGRHAFHHRPSRILDRADRDGGAVVTAEGAAPAGRKARGASPALPRVLLHEQLGALTIAEFQATRIVSAPSIKTEGRSGVRPLLRPL